MRAKLAGIAARSFAFAAGSYEVLRESANQLDVALQGDRIHGTLRLLREEANARKWSLDAVRLTAPATDQRLSVVSADSLASGRRAISSVASSSSGVRRKLEVI